MQKAFSRTGWKSVRNFSIPKTGHSTDMPQLPQIATILQYSSELELGKAKTLAERERKLHVTEGKKDPALRVRDSLV